MTATTIILITLIIFLLIAFYLLLSCAQRSAYIVERLGSTANTEAGFQS